MRRGETIRILLVLLGFAVVFSVFSWRLIDLQLVRHDEFARMASEKHVVRQAIPASRGNIVDRHGEVLAGNVPVRTVIADASLVTDAGAVAACVSRHLGMPESEVLGRLAGGRRHIVLRHKVPDDVADRLEESLRIEGLRGIRFEEEDIRIYPNDTMLSHVIGFINHEMVGVQGVERSMERHLAGEDGYRYTEKDRTGREIVQYRGKEKAPVNGCDVILTIDMGLQHIVESELDRIVETYDPVSATIVLMDPRGGGILALGNRPHFSPQRLGDSDVEDRHNHAVISMVEPGSTFKIVAAGAALNEGLVTPETVIFCENGRYQYGGRSLKDHHPYGDLSVSDVLVKSSNIGAAKLAIQLGERTFYSYVRRFGFGELSGIDLPGEIPGLVHPVHKWSRISITRIPMGHEIGATPIQMVAAMGVIANGGHLVRPHVVRSVVDAEGRTVRAFGREIRRRVLSREAAGQISRALEGVVGERGTAQRARVGRFRVAGKTGTAQRVDPAGGYTPGKYVVSFLGYLPAEDPAFVGLVLVDDPKTEPGMCYGGTVAAPVFAAIGERAVRYLDLEPPLPDIPLASSPKLSRSGRANHGGGGL